MLSEGGPGSRQAQFEQDNPKAKENLVPGANNARARHFGYRRGVGQVCVKVQARETNFPVHGGISGGEERDVFSPPRMREPWCRMELQYQNGQRTGNAELYPRESAIPPQIVDLEMGDRTSEDIDRQDIRRSDAANPRLHSGCGSAHRSHRSVISPPFVCAATMPSPLAVELRLLARCFGSPPLGLRCR